MAFTDFYVSRTNGSNLNAGSGTGAALLVNTGGTWVQATRVFSCSGSPDLSSVTVGDFASVMPDGTSTTTPFVGRITAVDNVLKTITIHATASSGTAPTDGTSTRTIRVGGAWAGPTGSTTFPYTFVTNTLTNASGDPLFVSAINDQTYSGLTAGITISNNGPMYFGGCTATARDGGVANFDWGTSNVMCMTSTGTYLSYESMCFKNAATTGTNSVFAVNAAGIQTRFYRCAFTGGRLFGLQITSGSSGGIEVLECEFYGNNTSNTANGAGLLVAAATCAVRRCKAHSNTGSNTSGIRLDRGTDVEDTVCSTNGQHGILCNSIATADRFDIIRSDFYNNTGSGLVLGSTTNITVNIESSNFVKNGAWGVLGSGAGVKRGRMANCGFGAGTQANTSGTTSTLGYITEAGAVTYAADVTPWVDPANGDFRITLSTAKNAGRGSFLELASGQSGTVSYPDIGAGQHLDSGGGSGGTRRIGIMSATSGTERYRRVAGFQQVTPLSSAVGLTAPTGYTLNAIGRVLVQAVGQNVRFRLDGTNPTTSVGHLLTAGDPPISIDCGIANAKFIETTSGATLEVTYLVQE